MWKKVSSRLQRNPLYIKQSLWLILNIGRQLLKERLVESDIYLIPSVP